MRPHVPLKCRKTQYDTVFSAPISGSNIEYDKMMAWNITAVFAPFFFEYNQTIS